MHYKGFTIEPEIVKNVTWDPLTTTFHIVSEEIVYKIKEETTNLEFGVFDSVQVAKSIIDQNGGRWRTN